jgi:cell division protein FtsW (lipid II flippase)
MVALVLGAGLFWLALKRRGWVERHSLWLLLIGLILLALPLVPGLGIPRNGVRRWVYLGGRFIGVGYWGLLLMLPGLARLSVVGKQKEGAADADKPALYRSLLFAGATGLGIVLLLLQNYPSLALLLTIVSLALAVESGFPSRSRFALGGALAVLAVALAASPAMHLLTMSGFGEPPKLYLFDGPSEQAVRLVRVLFGWPGWGCLVLLCLLGGWLSCQTFLKLPRGPERSQVLAAAGFLVGAMVLSLISGLWPGRVVAGFPFPFVSPGFQITLTSWGALGLLMGAAKGRRSPDPKGAGGPESSSQSRFLINGGSPQ